MLVVQRNGKMFLQDVLNKTKVCFLNPPKTFQISTPCSPVYALNTKQQTLVIQGKPRVKCSLLIPRGKNMFIVFVVILHYSLRNKIHTCTNGLKGRMVRSAKSQPSVLCSIRTKEPSNSSTDWATVPNEIWTAVTKGLHVFHRGAGVQLQRRETEPAVQLHFWRAWHHGAVYHFTSRLPETKHTGGSLQYLPPAKVAFFVSSNHNLCGVQ